MKKRILSVLTASIMTLTAVPFTAIAAETAPTTSQTSEAAEVNDLSVIAQKLKDFVKEKGYNATVLASDEKVKVSFKQLAVGEKEYDATAINSEFRTFCEKNSLNFSLVQVIFQVDAIAAKDQPVVVSETDSVSNGNYSENITWTITEDGRLIISGEGNIADRTESAPWSSRIGDIQTIIVEDSITSIGKSVFIGLEDVTSVSLPESIKSIGDEAFSKCVNLKTINLPDGLEKIGSSAFNQCQLESLTLPESITEIGYSAFLSCDFTSVTIPNNVKSIGECAFSYCENLEEVVIPDTVANIDGAFSHCGKLKEVTIPSFVEKIREDTFFACGNLENIIFMNPDTVICDADGNKCDTFFTSFEDGGFKGVIKGYKGSTAEEYSIKYKTAFEALVSEKAGDANGDGTMSMADAVLIMQSIANPAKYGIEGTNENHITEQGKKNSDITGDNDGVTNADALAIQKKLLKLD